VRKQCCCLRLGGWSPEYDGKLVLLFYSSPLAVHLGVRRQRLFSGAGAAARGGRGDLPLTESVAKRRRGDAAVKP